MEKETVFTPSLFFKCATCPHWVWHDLYSDLKNKGEVSELTKKLLEQGVIHEQDYIKDMQFTTVSMSQNYMMLFTILN